MNVEMIRTWLGLPAGPWPPNHYQLLGLEPGESNVVLIEQRPRQRLDAVRRYQLAHPEPATEALNRLAQAYVCLTEPANKERYDATLLGQQPVAVAGGLPCVGTDTPVPGKLLLRRGQPSKRPRVPPPLPAAAEPVPAPELVVPGISEEEVPTEEILTDSAIEATLPPLVPPTEEPATRSGACPLEEEARSRTARVGLCTRRGILRRIQLLRQLIRTWNNVGRLLPANDAPKTKLNQKAQTQALLRNLNKMEHLLEQFPKIFGQAGQTGFLVLSLREQTLTTKKGLALDLAQRAKLREDWEAGYALLRAHARLLGELTAGFRGLGLFGRMWHALKTTTQHQPLVALGLLALVVGNLLLWGWYAARWWTGQQLWPWN